MDRCKTILLTLAVIVGLGLTAGCEQDGNDDSTDEQASAEAAESDEQNEDQNAQADGQEPPLEATGPVAVVDGTEISAERFNEAVQQRAGAMGGRMPPRLANMMKTRTVQRLIDEHLIDKKLAAADIEVSDEEVTEEFNKFKERFPNEDAFKTFLDRNGLSAETMQEKLKKDLQLRKLLEEKYGVAVTQADAKEFYESNPKQFEQSEQVSARHILIKTEKDADEAAVAEAKKKAEAIAEEAQKSDTDFAALAEEKSEGPSASRGGDLGFFEKERMVPEFSEAAFNMEPGEVSDPVKSQFGFHVIKVEDKKEAGTVSFEEAEEKITEQLKRQKFGEAMKKFLAEIKKDVEIEKKPDNIQVNVQQPQGGNPMMGGQGGQGGMQLPPELRKKLQQRQKQQQQQQQQQGSQQGEDPTELKLKKPNVIDE